VVGPGGVPRSSRRDANAMTFRKCSKRARAILDGRCGGYPLSRRANAVHHGGGSAAWPDCYR